MANPIPLGQALVVDESIRRSQALETLLEQLADREQSLVQMLDIIELLDKNRMLPAIVAVLEQGNDVLQILLEQLERPEYVRGIQNMISIIQSLATSDFSTIKVFSSAITDGIQVAETGEGLHVKNVFEILKLLRDPDIAMMISFVATILKSMGRNLSSNIENGKSGVASS